MIEHAQRERQRERERVIQHLSLCKMFLQSKSLQRKICHQVSWRMPLFLQEITCQYFWAHGRDQGKIEGWSFIIKLPLNLHSHSTQNLVDPHWLSGQYLLWIISRRICITKPWLLEHWMPHCCALNRKHMSKHPWVELVIWTCTCHGDLSILEASSQKNVKHPATYCTLKGGFT